MTTINFIKAGYNYSDSECNDEIPKTTRTSVDDSEDEDESGDEEDEEGHDGEDDAVVDALDLATGRYYFRRQQLLKRHKQFALRPQRRGGPLGNEGGKRVKTRPRARTDPDGRRTIEALRQCPLAIA